MNPISIIRFIKIVDIKKKAAEREFAIEQERLDKQLEYDKKEEELRHKRLLDENGGGYDEDVLENYRCDSIREVSETNGTIRMEERFK